MSRATHNRFCHLYNIPSSKVVTDQAAQHFIDQLKKEIDAGYGFVPFIGAGLSAPSGIPLIWEIETYLQHCIGRALGLVAQQQPLWNPRNDQWPPFAGQYDDIPTKWNSQLQQAIDKRREEDRSDPDLRVLQEAQGAIAEWRTALLFLSRLTRERRGTGRDERDYFALDAPRQEVIDAGIREIMKGKRPTLGHRMLATLGGLLRLDIVLTTNFDDLLEQAFEVARNPLTVFGLHLASDLPPYAALAPQRSLVKLHGDRHSMRADYTLDAAPPELDRFHFLEYLVSASGHPQLLEQRGNLDKALSPLPVGNHLLVMGFSANERRTRTFIEHAWQRLEKQFSVFWLCHTTRDVERVQSFTSDAFTRLKQPPAPMQSRILRHTHLGLLFLQVFQTVRRSVPLTGLIFPSASRLAIPPVFIDTKYSKTKEPTEALTAIMESLTARVAQITDSSFTNYRVIVVTSHKEVPGVTSVGSQLFDTLQDNKCCVWLEMNDIMSTDDLFEQLLDATYYRLGIESWMPVFVPPDEHARAGEIRRLVRTSTQPWVFFLNARERPGSNIESDSNLTVGASTKEPVNGWLDLEQVPEDADDTSACVRPFVSLLSALCEPGHGGPSISVVLLTHSEHTPQASDDRHADHDCPAGSVVNQRLQDAGVIDTVDILERVCVSYNNRTVIRDCIRWTLGEWSEDDGGAEIITSLCLAAESTRRRRFLLALLLMQRTRFLSSIWSSAFFEEDPSQATDATKDRMLSWVTELERYGLVRRKHGGFIWLRAVSRKELRAIFTSSRTIKEHIEGHAAEFDGFRIANIAEWCCENDIPTIHFNLALWYRRVLLATESPGAVFEAVYHSCKSAEALLATTLQDGDAAKIVERLAWACALLRSNEFMIQTRGYSRGSCRRLDGICLRHVRAIREKSDELRSADKLSIEVHCDIRSTLTELEIISTEIMRAIAREVGENAKAYVRHKRLRSLVTNPDSPPDLWETSVDSLAKHLFPDRNGGAVSVYTQCAAWLRHLRWTGMLGIASRSYVSAQRALMYGLVSANTYDDISRAASIKVMLSANQYVQSGADNQMETATTLLQNFTNNYRIGNRRMFGRRYSNPEHVCLEVLRTAEQCIDVDIQMKSAEGRAESARTEWALDTANALLESTQAATTLAEVIIAQDRSASAPYIPLAMWCKSRLLLHASICESRVRRPDEAMALLTEAEACLAAVDSRRHGTDHALVELYRAEVQLHQAARVEVRFQKGMITFSALRSMIREPVRDAFARQMRGDELRKQLFGADGRPAVFKRVKAVVRDAVRFLDRAESLLANRRRNVGWTTWYFQRRLEAVALSLWSSILDEGTPIPFLGLSAAPAQTQSIADEALHHSLRIIRLDVYRLATIVDAYASCAEALRVRLLLDKGTPRVVDRQILMRGELEAALEKLTRMLKEREATVSEIAGKAPRDTNAQKKIVNDASLYGPSKNYIEEVVQKQVLGAIVDMEHPLRQ